MKLSEAFEIARGEVVAFVGAGGKTSTLVTLGYELAEQGWRVLATTTTRVGAEQLSLLPHALRFERGASAMSAALNDHRLVFIHTDIRGDKAHGITPAEVSWLLDAVDADALLIEADGARGLPLKAPREHEPVIPAETSLVVPMAALTVLGQPLDDDHVFNVGAIIDRYGFPEGAAIKSPWVSQILRDHELGLRGVPDQARVIGYLNRTPPNGYERGRARFIANLMLRSPRITGVALGSARHDPPVYEVQRSIGAVILAAGMSRRMGQPKVLLPWTDGATIIEHIINQVLLARVDHISVVTGHMADRVAPLVERKGVQAVYNADYARGDMLSSLQAGLRALPEQAAAALVVLGDQPRIQSRIISQVMTAYAEGAGRIVAPSYRMRRGHPILIDRRYWPEILNLPADDAPRTVINAHADEIAYVTVDTDSVLRDVDTPDDYQQERWRAGLS